jgi:hypothetical protein
MYFHLIKVIRTPMLEANHASLTYQDGLSAAGAATFGATHFACVDFFVPCLAYIVTPNSNFYYFFPPPNILPIDGVTYQDLQQYYINLNLTTVEENTLVVVVGINFGGYFDLPNPYRSDQRLVFKNAVFDFVMHIHLFVNRFP